MSAIPRGFRPPPATSRSADADDYPAAVVLTGALGIWMGIQGFRAMAEMIVWNTPGEDAAVDTLGAVALGIYAIGLAGGLPVRLLGPRAPLVLAILFAVATLARQVVVGHLPTLVFSWASAVTWLWWLGAFLRELDRRGYFRAVLPSALLGIGFLVAGQTALHGLDVPLLREPEAGIAGLLQVALFLSASGWAARRAWPDERPAPASLLGLLALGPFLFVELVLLANFGRVQVATGLPASAAALLILGSLAIGLASLGRSWPRPVRLVLALVAVALAIPGLTSGLTTAVALLIVQVSLVQALAALFDRSVGTTGPSGGRLYLAAIGGALLFFVLLQTYYARFGPPLWPVGVALVVGLGSISGRTTRLATGRWLGLLAAVAVIGLAGGLVPSGSALTAGSDPAPATLRIVSYNLFQGLNVEDVPGMPAIADFIQDQAPDLASFYEVNRGWDVSGGIDMVTYLRWRFPGYQVLSAPSTDDLFVNVIMSRYPISDWGAGLFPVGKGPRHGYLWARISTRAGALLYIASHLSNDSADDRVIEARVLLGLWHNQPRTIVAGDFNAPPDEPAPRLLVSAGLRDAVAERGHGDALTFPATNPTERLDYILTSGDLVPAAAMVVHVPTSDHLPLVATVQLP